ncbi:MAG: hypothetical protein HYY84_13400 [Deltaproteobacteria bacterium]|nr:hypothetical protein [Deltaproteobacteria bacterium]
MKRDDFENETDADREVLRRWAADSSQIKVSDNFDAAVLAKVVAARNRAPISHRRSHMRWAIPALAAAAALVAFLITRPLDDARDATPVNETSAPLARSDDDEFSLSVDLETTSLPETVADSESFADVVLAEVFSREEIAFLDGRGDDAMSDEIADEISEMSDDAARGFESALDAAKKTKSG